MSIAFYMDENVHRGITDGLRIRNVDVLTNYFGLGIGDFGLKTSPWLFKQGIIQNRTHVEQ